jgi:hypothetical protein
LRNRILVSALTAVVALSLAAVALANPASDTSFDVTLKVPNKSKKSGTKKKPRPVAFTLGMKGDTISGTGQPATTTDFLITLPKQWKWNGKLWAKKNRCSVSEANAEKSFGACPKGSRIGSGDVVALGGNGGIIERLTVDAAVTTSGNLGLFIRANAPVAIAYMLEGKVSKKGVIRVHIDQNIQEPVPGVPTGIEDLTFTLNGKTKAKGKRRGIVESVGCKKSWSIKVKNQYRDGSKTKSAKVSCKKP